MLGNEDNNEKLIRLQVAQKADIGKEIESDVQNISYFLIYFTYCKRSIDLHFIKRYYIEKEKDNGKTCICKSFD